MTRGLGQPDLRPAELEHGTAADLNAFFHPSCLLSGLDLVSGSLPA